MSSSLYPCCFFSIPARFGTIQENRDLRFFDLFDLIIDCLEPIYLHPQFYFAATCLRKNWQILALNMQP